MELSGRMEAVARLVPAGHIAADVGCDHGFVSIYLIQKGICPHVYAADVRPGPLGRAKEHIAQFGLEKRITAVLSDGLRQVPVGRDRGAEVMIAAGMGGKLTIRILSDVPEKTAELTAVVLEPQSEVWLVRRFLREKGFVITAEDFVREEGKYYPVIQAFNTAGGRNRAAAEEAGRRMALLKERMKAAGLEEGEIEEAFDRFGPMLISAKSAVLLSFLQHTIEKDSELFDQLPDSEEKGEKAERVRQRVELLKERILLAQKVQKLME